MKIRYVYLKNKRGDLKEPVAKNIFLRPKIGKELEDP